VNGHAIAGGCVLALCCDWRVAVDRADVRIGLNEVALGLEFPPMIMNLVRDRIPRRHVERVVLEAGLHDRARRGTSAWSTRLPPIRCRSRRPRSPGWLASRRQPSRRPSARLRTACSRSTTHSSATSSSRIVPSWCAPETKERITAQLRR
jgi:hypothetical protein